MNFYKMIKLAIVAATLSVSAVQASDSVGIVASISPNKQKTISFAVDTRGATQNLVTQSNQPMSDHYYWLERKDCSSYHATLDLLKKKDGTNFGPQDHHSLEQFMKNFSVHAKALNDPKNKVKGKKAYRANGYELRLFVHYADGSHHQFNAANINSVMNSNQPILYANLVLKLGTHAGLKKDWKFVQNKHIPNAFARAVNHNLETHITIANIFKYSKAQNKIVNNAVQRKNGKSPWNEPFDNNNPAEMRMLVDAFNLTNSATDFNKLKGISIDRLELTGKQNGAISTIKTVKF